MKFSRTQFHISLMRVFGSISRNYMMIPGSGPQTSKVDKTFPHKDVLKNLISSQTMKIEQGKFYRTRGGRKARVYATDGAGKNCMHGALQSNKGWYSSSWQQDGRNNPLFESEYDLIEEWVDKPVFDQSKLPKWMAIAMGPDKKWFAFTEVPAITDHYNNWRCAHGASVYAIPEDSYPTYDGPWEQSLLIL